MFSVILLFAIYFSFKKNYRQKKYFSRLKTIFNLNMIEVAAWLFLSSVNENESTNESKSFHPLPGFYYCHTGYTSIFNNIGFYGIVSIRGHADRKTSH